MKHLLHLLLFLLLFTACKKEEIKRLPPATTTGANTIGALVNGKAWIAESKTMFAPKKYTLWYTNYFKPQKRFALFSSRINSDENSYIILAVEDVRETGTQFFSFDTNPYPANALFKNHAVYSESKPTEGEYVTNSRHTGSIIFTRVDTVNHILSGVFEFTAESTDGSGQTIRVTDGRFDIKYGQQ